MELLHDLFIVEIGLVYDQIVADAKPLFDFINRSFGHHLAEVE